MSPHSEDAFESKVRPVLLAKCVACHGPKQQAGKLRLDGPITPDQAFRLVDAISYDGLILMPPTGKLPADELAALTKWAEAGAPWPVAKPSVKPNAALWSLGPVKVPGLPKVKNKAWAQTPLDTFILAKLESKGLKPAPTADRRTLIRRATFDLTGLPPTPREVDAFLADQAPGAFERVVDRLLASPAYGERWGRHWLDVARYADSNGLDENLVFENAWRYRDWVIGAINQDKPIDRFIHEQIAGDLLPGGGDNEMVATGFLAIGAKMLAEDDPVKQELDTIDEQVDTLSKAFLGLTVGCARCHDHKFDPITAKDYYAMAGIFKSTKTMNAYKVVAEWFERPLGTKEEKEKVAKIEAQVKAKTDEANKIRKEAADARLKELQPQTAGYEKAARELLEQEKGRTQVVPVIATPDGKAPAEAIVFEAESFVRGNASRDTNGFGQGVVGIILNGGQYPNVAEYDVTVPQGGPYQLDFRYASGEERPVRVFANGKLALSNAATKSTGGFYAKDQLWAAQGVILLQAGKNTLKLEREIYFPHFDKILLVSRPGAVPTEHTNSFAADRNLHPIILRDIANRIKNKIDVRIELPDPADPVLPEAIAGDLKKRADEIAELNKTKPKLPRAMVVGESKPTDLKVHIRGDYLNLGENSPRRFPSVVAGPVQPKMPANQSGRLELAKWITDAKNPLTARVFVNRVWRWRFGRGLVGSVDNFGVLGDKPTHPELLDWLATTFVKEDKWSLKKLHRRMMLSSTYMMSGNYNPKAANLDPDNTLLYRFPRKRLEAEAIRDSIMAVSGKLDRKMGGTLLNFKPREYVTGTDSADKVNYSSPRRAVYLPVVRSALYDVYTAFDFGDPSVMNGDRPSTTIAPQALFMLNSAVILDATKSQAESMLKQNASDKERVKQLYLTCYGRPPTDKEVTRSLDYLKKFEQVYAKAKNPKLSAWQSLCKSIIAANEFIYVE